MEHQKIIDAIEAAGETVYYGKALPGDGDIWDYTVFHRAKNSKNKTKTSKTEYFRVAVVREGFITDEDIDKVEEAVLSVDGVKGTEDDVYFDYARRSNGVVAEVASMMFYVPRKIGV